jgi:hypothetical protein
MHLGLMKLSYGLGQWRSLGLRGSGEEDESCCGGRLLPSFISLCVVDGTILALHKKYIDRLESIDWQCCSVSPFSSPPSPRLLDQVRHFHSHFSAPGYTKSIKDGKK